MRKLGMVCVTIASAGVVGALPASVGAGGADYATVKLAAKRATEGGRVRLLVMASFTDPDEGGTVVLKLTDRSGRRVGSAQVFVDTTNPTPAAVRLDHRARAALRARGRLRLAARATIGEFARGAALPTTRTFTVRRALRPSSDFSSEFTP